MVNFTMYTFIINYHLNKFEKLSNETWLYLFARGFSRIIWFMCKFGPIQYRHICLLISQTNRDRMPQFWFFARGACFLFLKFHQVSIKLRILPFVAGQQPSESSPKYFHRGHSNLTLHSQRRCKKSFNIAQMCRNQTRHYFLKASKG